MDCASILRCAVCTFVFYTTISAAKTQRQRGMQQNTDNVFNKNVEVDAPQPYKNALNYNHNLIKNAINMTEMYNDVMEAPPAAKVPATQGMDEAFKALVQGGSNWDASVENAAPQNAKQAIKRHGDHKEQADGTDATEYDDYFTETPAPKDKDNEGDLLPESVTQADIKPIGHTNDELEDLAPEADELGGNVPDDIDNEKMMDDELPEDINEDAGDMEDLDDMTSPGFRYKHGLKVENNHKRDERSRKRRRFYKPKDGNLNADDLNDGMHNAGLAAALRYLGSGYDIVFGNPLGDPTIMVDPGYRDPVLKLDWTEEYHNNDGANIKEPRGAWIRPELSCRQAESVDHVDSVEDYKKELSVDAQLSIDVPFYFSFSASSGYKNFVKTISANVTKNYIIKTYCLRYVAGIHDLKNVDTMPSFKMDVAALPDHLDIEHCAMDKYRNNEDDPDCATTIRPWMRFFQKYGTHYTTIIHLGGKVTNQIQLKKTDVASLQKSGYNIDTVVKTNAGLPFLNLGEAGTQTNGETVTDTKKLTVNNDKQVIVIGGNVPTDGADKGSMKDWIRSLYKNPMPIKVSLESIKTLVPDEKKKDIFDSALRYYSEVYGISPDEMYKSEGKERGVASLTMAGKVVIYEGKSGGSAVCPQNHVVMMGFVLSITRKTKNMFSDVELVPNLTQCLAGKEKCVSSTPDGKTDVKIWILCGEKTIPLLIQETKVADNAPAVASCPPDYAIAFGFGLSIPKGLEVGPLDSYACRAGQSTCTHSSNKAKRNAVWIACVEKSAPELSDITSYAVAVSSPACTKTNKHTDFKDAVCPNNANLIAGWQMQITEKDKEITPRMMACPISANGCRIDKRLLTQQSTCKTHYSWVSCYSPSEVAEAKA